MADAPKLFIPDDWKSSKKDPQPSTPATPTPAAGLQIDSDWKAQAQAEKEKLEATAAQKGAGKGAPGKGQMPPADFRTLVGEMVSRALMFMGAFPDPETGRAVVSLEYAQFYIDLIGVLETKTKGNTTPEEAQELAQVLSELRMQYVHLQGAVAKMQAERLAKGAGPGSSLPGMPGAPGGLQF